MPAAAFATVANLVPVALPLFAPGERQFAHGANLGGEIGLFTLLGHGGSEQV